MVTVKVTGPPGSSTVAGDAVLSTAIAGRTSTALVSVAVLLAGFGSVTALVTVAVFV